MRERIYSTISDLTIKNLKLWNFDSLIDCSQTIAFAKQHDISAQLRDSSDYHIRFEKCKPKPSIMYGMGDWSLLDRSVLGVVWPREPSSYWLDVTTDLIRSCSWSNLVTISGWADGIDECVHQQSILHQIQTIVVLWWGLWWFLQSSHRSQFLKHVVEKWWLILSEFKLFARPEKYTFPQRNRIIAWLSDHLFIPEAWLKSGSLITAVDAVKMWIPVWTVPHSIYSKTASWIIDLVQSWSAQYVYSLSDRLNDSFSHQASQDDAFSVSLTDRQNIIIRSLHELWSITLDKIHLSTWIDLQILIWELAVLEMEWVVTADVFWNYTVKY